jgi:hypothetical protein
VHLRCLRTVRASARVGGRPLTPGALHEASLREIFRLARIEYGRMDYALLGGRLQVWEINTNPTIATPGSEMGPRAAAKRLVRERMVTAFEALADARHMPASSSVVPHSR